MKKKTVKWPLVGLQCLDMSFAYRKWEIGGLKSIDMFMDLGLLHNVRQ